MITEQLYMYITDSPDHFWIESYTKYITTLDGFADMFTDIIENEDDYYHLKEIYSTTYPLLMKKVILK